MVGVVLDSKALLIFQFLRDELLKKSQWTAEMVKKWVTMWLHVEAQYLFFIIWKRLPLSQNLVSLDYFA